MTQQEHIKEEAFSEIKDYIYVLKDQREGSKLTKQHETKQKRFNDEQQNRLKRKLDGLCRTSKGRRPLQAPNRLIAEFNMGCYGYGDSASQRVLIGAHVKFSD